jgi:hypothetical protein
VHGLAVNTAHAEILLLEERVVMTWDVPSLLRVCIEPTDNPSWLHDGQEGTQAGQRAARSELDWLYILPGNSSRAVYGESAQREAIESDLP